MRLLRPTLHLAIMLFDVLALLALSRRCRVQNLGLRVLDVAFLGLILLRRFDGWFFVGGAAGGGGEGAFLGG